MSSIYTNRPLLACLTENLYLPPAKLNKHLKSLSIDWDNVQLVRQQDKGLQWTEADTTISFNDRAMKGYNYGS